MSRARPRWAGPLTLLLVSAGATAALAEPVRRILLKQGSLDVPNHRSSHTAPVPRGGGIAAVLGAATAGLMYRACPGPRASVGTLAIAALGLADDLSGHVPARVRLAGQLLAGSSMFANSPTDAVVAAPVTAGVVNAVNFMDGINGISGLTALLWGANALLVEDDGDGHLATLGALAAGSALGFLPHNFPKAHLFLGDVGSYGLGAAMAAGILSQRTLLNRYRVGAPLMLYGIDVGHTLLSRAIHGKRIGQAHRDHVYQRLVDGGQSHTSVAIAHALGAMIATLVAHQHRRSTRIIGSVMASAAYLLLPTLMNNTNANINTGTPSS